MLIAEAIDPKLNGEEYMDRADNENELKQVYTHRCIHTGTYIRMRMCYIQLMA